MRAGSDVTRPIEAPMLVVRVPRSWSVVCGWVRVGDVGGGDGLG